MLKKYIYPQATWIIIVFCMSFVVFLFPQIGNSTFTKGVLENFSLKWLVAACFLPAFILSLVVLFVDMVGLLSTTDSSKIFLQSLDRLFFGLKFISNTAIAVNLGCCTILFSAFVVIFLNQILNLLRINWIQSLSQNSSSYKNPWIFLACVVILAAYLFLSISFQELAESIQSSPQLPPRWIRLLLMLVMFGASGILLFVYQPK